MLTFNAGREDFDANASVVLLLAPERAKPFHHETLAGRHLKAGGVLLDDRFQALADADQDYR